MKLIVDLTTKNKNKMKETGDWFTNEVKHINTTVNSLTLNIQKNGTLQTNTQIIQEKTLNQRLQNQQNVVKTRILTLYNQLKEK